MYFITENLLLKRFDAVEIKHVLLIENQEVNDLAQIASGYKVPKGKLEDLIKVIEKLIMISLSPSKLSKSQLMEEKEFEEWTNSEISKICEILSVENMSNNDRRKPIIEFLQNPTGTTY